MKVRLLKSIEIEGHKYKAGAIVDMDDSMAQSLVNSSAASYDLDDGVTENPRSVRETTAHRWARITGGSVVS